MPAGAIAGSGVLSAGASLFGSSSAAKSQEKAAKIAAQTQLQMYDQTRSDLAPYRDLGGYAGTQLQNRLTDLTSPIVMDQNALAQTPGYQFTLSQGLKAAQSSAAARGLGLSGAAIKGASDYTTGLADKTYLDQFNVANTNQTNAFNRLFQATSLGQTAAAGQATNNLLTGSQVAQTQVGAGKAAGAGAIAAGNAIGSGGNALAQYLSGALMKSGNGNSFYGSPMDFDAADRAAGSQGWDY